MKKFLITFLSLTSFFFFAAPTFAATTFSTGLVGLWSFDGADVAGTTAYDRSGSGNNGAYVGTPSKTAGKLGQAFNFKASSGVSVTDNASLKFGTGNFTVSVWVNDAATQPASLPAIINKNTGDLTSGSAAVGWGIIWYNTTYYNFIVGDGTANIVRISFTPITHNTWHLLTATVGSTYITLYEDGARVNQAARAITGSIDTTNALSIGRWDVFARNWNGSADDVRIYNRELSASEVVQLYKLGGGKVNDSQTTKNSSGLVGVWSFDGPDIVGTTAYDRSGQGNDGTLQGSTPLLVGKIGQAINLNGSTRCMDANANNNSLKISNGTISSWIKTSGAGSSYRGIVVKQSAYGIFLKDNIFGAYDWGSGAWRPSTYPAITDNKWHFVAMTLQVGVTGGTTLYVDGVAAGTVTISSVASQNVSIAIGAGLNPCSGNQVFTGAIDDARVYNRVFSPSEILQLYKLGNATVNASQTTKLTTGLIGLWSFDGQDMSGTQAYDRSGSWNNGTLVASPTKVAGKLGQGLRFDSVNQYAAISSSPASNIAVTTISFWANIPTTLTSSNGRIIEKGYNVEWSVTMGSTQDGKIYFYPRVRNVSADGISTPYVTNQWAHYVFVIDSEGNRIYVNGVLAVNRVQSGETASNGTALIYIARAGNGSTSYPQKFSIDDVRIYNRALSASEVSQLYMLGTNVINSR